MTSLMLNDEVFSLKICCQCRKSV